MKNIIANKEDNIGGLYSFLVVPIADVVSVPDVEEGILDGNVELLFGKIWYTVDVTPEANNMSFSDASKDGLTASVTGFIAGDSPYLVDTLKTYADYEYFLVIATDLNGNKRLIGNIDNPAKFTYGFDTNGRRGYQISFSTRTLEAPPFLEFTGTDPNEEPGSCPIIYEIDGGDENTSFDIINGNLDGGDEI